MNSLPSNTTKSCAKQFGMAGFGLSILPRMTAIAATATGWTRQTGWSALRGQPTDLHPLQTARPAPARMLQAG